MPWKGAIHHIIARRPEAAVAIQKRAALLRLLDCFGLRPRNDGKRSRLAALVMGGKGGEPCNLQLRTALSVLR
jgi:hypothetical protein